MVTVFHRSSRVVVLTDYCFDDFLLFLLYDDDNNGDDYDYDNGGRDDYDWLMMMMIDGADD